MVCTHQDTQEFDKQIKELLDEELIKSNKHRYISPSFMVGNHAEEKKKKVRMITNCKKLNDNITFVGYYVPNKIVLFNRIQRDS